MNWIKKLFRKPNKEQKTQQFVTYLNRYTYYHLDLDTTQESAITKWGAWACLARGDNYKVKMIMISKDQRFSLQYHHKRDELWMVVSGAGKFTVDGKSHIVTAGQCMYIPQGTHHRAECTGDEDLKFIEIQYGECSEDDIVRLEDDYGRAGNSSINS